MKIAMIVIGGGAGALCRYLISGWGQRLTSGVFPLGTLIVNVLGCFLNGLLAHLLNGVYPVRPEVRLGLLVGFLGAFTTYSTFGHDTMILANEGQMRSAGLYVLLSNGLGLAAVWFGYRLAQQFEGV